jgi:hypothetical protein
LCASSGHRSSTSSRIASPLPSTCLEDSRECVDAALLHRRFSRSSSGLRRTVGASGLFVLTQCGKRPDSYRDQSRLGTIPRGRACSHCTARHRSALACKVDCEMTAGASLARHGHLQKKAPGGCPGVCRTPPSQGGWEMMESYKVAAQVATIFVLFLDL